MNDVQMHAMSLQRHQRALAREAAKAANPPSEGGFEAKLEKVAPAALPETAAITPPAATLIAPAMADARPQPAIAAAPERRTLVTGSAPQTVEQKTAALPQLTPDQAALLAASFGAALPEEPAPASPAPVAAAPTALPQAAPAMARAAAPASATPATPDLSDDQMNALMAAFGQPEAPPAAAALSATAIPQANDDNLRYFPINRANAAADTTAQMTASDTYLRAMQSMERNLGAYGGLTRNDR